MADPTLARDATDALPGRPVISRRPTRSEFRFGERVVARRSVSASNRRARRASKATRAQSPRATATLVAADGEAPDRAHGVAETHVRFRRVPVAPVRVTDASGSTTVVAVRADGTRSARHWNDDGPNRAARRAELQRLAANGRRADGRSAAEVAERNARERARAGVIGYLD